MIVRPVREDDLPDLAALWYEKNILTAVRAGSTTAEWTDQARRWIADLACGFFAVERDQRVIGYGVGALLPSIPGLADHPVGAITQIALDAHGYHGGAGRLLVDAIRGWLVEQGARRIMVFAPRYFAPEQAFWRSLGVVVEVDVMWLKS